MNEDFFDRLDKYISIKQLNDNKVTVQSGIPVGSLGKQRKGTHGTRGLSVVNIAKILYVYTDLNADWLITGRGEMLNSDPSPISDREEIEKLRAKIEEQGKEIAYWKGRAGVDLKSEPA